MSMTISRRETITYANDTWEFEVTENSHNGITYTLYLLGTNEPVLTINTHYLVKLEQVINQVIPNIHVDRSKLLS